MTFLVHKSTFCFFLAVSFVTCQYYELETGGEDYQEGPGEAEESDVVNATKAPVSRVTQATATNGSSTPSMMHVLKQVDNVISNVETLNITGIVDQALGIRNNTAVRNLVNSIMKAVFCNNFLAGYNNCGHRN